MSRRTDFIYWLKYHVGDMYVWGAQGECVSNMSSSEAQSWIRKMETSTTNANRAIDFMKKSSKLPLYAFDCSGLVMKYLMDMGYYKSDMSSRGLYSACEKIDRSDLEAGDLVFRHNGQRIHHVGVYVGDGMVIEAKGRDDGVVMRLIDASGTSYWNRYGRLAAITDEEMPDVSADEPTVITLTDPYMRGEKVKALQSALNALGYDCGDADGIAGKKTLAGIAAFVEAHDTDGEDVPDVAEPEYPITAECSVVIGGRKYIGDIGMEV